jgi:DNA repair exonuclease SbcCD ATPase subunit
LKIVGVDLDKNIAKKTQIETNIESHESDVGRYEEEIAALQGEVTSDWGAEKKRVDKEVQRLANLKQSQIASKDLYDDMQFELDNKRADFKLLTSKLQDARSRLYAAQKVKLQAEALIRDGKCPQCTQPSSKAGKSMLQTAQQVIDKDQATVQQLKLSSDIIDLWIKKADRSIRDYKINCERTEDQLDSAREMLRQVDRSAKEEEARNAKLSARKTAAQRKLSLAKRALQACRELLHEVDIERERYEYAKKAFHRSGMPMYLSAALCPVLNAVAEEYSDVFYSGKIKVLFEVEDGEFTVQLINPAGSGRVKGQSVGESAMAGSITAFALRDVAPRTNLLIIDEPGHGLDSIAARLFAQGLLKLKERYESILVTTHNAIIESVLGGEKIWTVSKKNKISRLLV